jgi:hypothetical protein
MKRFHIKNNALSMPRRLLLRRPRDEYIRMQQAGEKGKVKGRTWPRISRMKADVPLPRSDFRKLNITSCGERF